MGWAPIPQQLHGMGAGLLPRACAPCKAACGLYDARTRACMHADTRPPPPYTHAPHPSMHATHLPHR